ncbi:hypothetical protein [Pleomorphomonas sp. PLEO]|uniref:hypothetical protein n=1 Tax=Pleomorphomonas sp. PLEO TaxID=3239306 RepID=UPI00351DC786
MPTLDELAALDAERRRKLPAAAAIVFDTERDDPDAAARDVRIARELSRASGYRVPRSLVSQYRTDFQQLSAQERARKILAASPKTAEWWIDPDNAAQSKDDLESLARIERVARDGWVKHLTAIGGKTTEVTERPLSRLSSQTGSSSASGNFDLPRRISRARYMPKAKVEAIKRDIEKLAAAGASYASTSFGNAQDAQIVMMRRTLSEVLEGSKSPRDALALLQPSSDPLTETGKAALKAVVGDGIGGSVDFAGYMLSALSDSFVYPTVEGHFDLARRISRARYVPQAEVEAINQDIDRLAAQNAPSGVMSFGQAQDAQIAMMRRILSDVLDGSKQPRDAFDLLQPMFGGLSYQVTETEAAKRAALAPRISQAKTASKRELAAIDRDIDLLLSGTDRDVVRSVLEKVQSGAIESAEALDSLQRWLDSPFDTLGKDLQRAGGTVQKIADEHFSTGEGYENSISQAIGSGIGTAALLGLTGFFGGAGSAALLGGMMTGDKSLNEAKEARADKRTQTKAAAGGFFSGAITSLPLERLLFDPVIKGERFLGFLEWFGKRPVTEGTKNAFQQWLQNAAAINTYDPNRSWNFQVGNSFLGGASAVGLFDAVGPALRLFAGREANARTAEHKQAVVKAILDESAGSTTRERAPETFESFLKHLSKDGPIEYVHLPAATFDQYYRSQGIDPLTIIDTLTGVSRTDFAAAMAASGDLRIPTATYATRIVDDADVALRPHLRVDPADAPPTAPDATPGVPDTAPTAPEATSPQQDDTYHAATQEVHDGTISELSAAGYSPEAAASEALLRSTLYKTMATRAGTSPMPPIIPASPDALLQSDIPALNSDSLMNSTSHLALDGRDKAAPPNVLPETMNDVQKRVDLNPIYGPERPRNHWED